MPDIVQNKMKVVIKTADLPLSCPQPNVLLWDKHPKVYLDFDADNKVICPYCSTVYELANE